MSGWILAIDVGTTSTAAARRSGDRVEMIQLQNGPRMPSMVFWREGTSSSGRLVLGTEAEDLSTLAPWCLEPTPKSRLGEEFIQLGDKQLRPVEIIAAILREVYNEAISLAGGEPPAEIRLTHPARWRKLRLQKLAEAAKLAGLSEPVFVPEPLAAAVHFASERLTDGEHVAVYDLGGGTLDTAVLKRSGDSFELVGRTGGNEELGGENFDELLYRYLGDQLQGDAWRQMRSADQRRDRAWGQANRELRRHARLAKERLSSGPEYDSYAAAPVDQELHATATDFEALIAPTLKGTVSELERTILAAGLQVADMKAIYLAGGSSRIPLVGRLIREQLGITPEHLDDPKAVIAMGAARLQSAAAADAGVEKSPLPQREAPIPALPGSEQAKADQTSPAATDPDATHLDRKRPAPPPPPVPSRPPDRPAPAPPPPPAPGQPETVGPRRRGGLSGKVIAGVAAAVLLIGGAAAAIVLSGGGDDDGGGDPPPPTAVLAGTWEGAEFVDSQTGADTRYDLQVDFAEDGQSGTQMETDPTGSECGGTLTLLEEAGPQEWTFAYEETQNTDTCVPEFRSTVRLDGDGTLDYTSEVPAEQELTNFATLMRQPEDPSSDG